MKNRLRDELERRGMTQAELAERAGIAPSQLSHIVRGSGCTVMTAYKIADALKIDVQDIFPRNAA